MIRSSKLIEELTTLQQQQQQLTGIFKIQSPNNRYWQLYFCLGKLVWADGGSHIYRSWRRYITLFCPEVDFSDINVRDTAESEHPHYHLLVVLLQRKIVKTEQIKFLIAQKIKEIIFDILQLEHKQSLQYIYEPQSSYFLLKAGFSISLSPDNFAAIVTQAQLAWYTWAGKGLAACSPNLAPSLKNAQQLRQELSPLIYHNMARLLNGQHSLRELALKMNMDVFELTCVLMPYFFKGYLKLAEIPDLCPIVINKEGDPALRVLPHRQEHSFADCDYKERTPRVPLHLRFAKAAPTTDGDAQRLAESEVAQNVSWNQKQPGSKTKSPQLPELESGRTATKEWT
ncbi:hypothetical protein IQ238_01975 [Pleurocapsales cyanobacterium LEGE 06147]|nr:hypothetical protein [Pleurocapsales cyanobacterium LEGE 06147]